jgi:hypothetical protein
MFYAGSLSQAELSERYFNPEYALNVFEISELAGLQHEAISDRDAEIVRLVGLLEEE